MCGKDGLEEIIESLGVDPPHLEFSQEAKRAYLVAETYLTMEAVAHFLDMVYLQEDHPSQPSRKAVCRLSELREILRGLTLPKLNIVSEYICHLILRDIFSGPDGRFRLGTAATSEIAFIVSRLSLAEIESGWGKYVEGWVETNDNKKFFYLARKALGEDREKRLKEWVKKVKKDCSWLTEGLEEQE